MIDADVLVIGGGLAGLGCALTTSRSVIVVNDTLPAHDVASAWAQGGLAAALGSDDSPALHAIDTLAAAGGIADARIVDDLTAQAPGAVALLERLGVPFDRRPDGSLALGLEAAHSRRRIVHAADHTGATIVRRLLEVLALRPSVSIRLGLRAIDLIGAGAGRVVGARFVDAAGGRVDIMANAVVLASGGYGGLFAQTTTPAATLGAGLAMAQRAGATLGDLEFIQFHPTALASGVDPMPLISEAVRGEGAILIDDAGRRFVDELGPRDVVARAIFRLEERGGRAYLDARKALGASFASRFPTIAARCLRAGVDPAQRPIPVTPAAHYTIGGVVTDERARTAVDGLWACGEVASTGLHGANRLASNSLVEALVFGMRAAADIDAVQAVRSAMSSSVRPGGVAGLVADLPAALEPLRRAMSEFVGVVRDESGLLRALDACDALAGGPFSADPRVGDAVMVARGVVAAALDRRESRGAHFRRDFPTTQAHLATRSLGAVREPVAGGS